MDVQHIFQFKKMLQNLELCMNKAAGYADSKKFEVDVYTTYRLAPDMYTFTKQIQSACDAAKFCAAYLSGQEAPVHEDNETTWNQLRERVRKVITYLDGFKEADFTKASAVQVKPRWAGGKYLTANEYMHELAIPNFYFHMMAAYAILRHAGVDIGKQDYIGSLNLK